MGAESAILLLIAAAAADSTDFGIRAVGVPVRPAPVAVASGVTYRPLGGASPIGAVTAAAAQWGRVTSTLRTPERNRLVGGVANSFHLSGRAVDIARRPGVSHDEIAAGLRRLGYRLVESLDEGDHSHFAFAFGSEGLSRPERSVATAASGPAAPAQTSWRIVSAPR